MTGSKRALAVFAAGALFAPLVSFTSPAFAAGEADPPPPRDVSEVCQNVPEDFDPFTDINNNTFEQNIICLAFADITEGGPGTLPDDQYGPGLAVIRGQMASFIARLIDTANEEDTGDNVRDLPAFDGDEEFIDVDPGYVHREAIARLSEAGIVEGGPGGRPENVYGPELEVTRAQMASFIIRALEFMTGDEFDTALDFFVDDENAAPHEPNINAVAAEAIAVGDGEDQYNPFQSVSRGQMSAFLTRTLAVLFEDGDISAIGDEDETPAPDVIVETEEVTAGEPIEFTIDADNISSVEVSGDCVDEQTFEVDGDTTEDGFQVSIPTNEDADAGSCTINLVITDEDGVESEASFTVDIVEDTAPDVTVEDQTIAAGQPIQFTVEGDDIDSVVVSGDCVDNVTREDDADTTEDGFQVSVPTRNNATAGQCTINLVITNEDGEEFEDSFVVTIEAQPSATVRPELVSAQITDTVSQGEQSPSRLTGTYVTFTFDESIALFAPALSQFQLYNADGTLADSAADQEISRSGNSVTLRFDGEGTGNDLSTDAAAGRLTLATVDPGAVQDSDGRTNPEGDAGIGQTTAPGQTGQAGVTRAPDLVSVGGFRQGATAGTTAVDFTFDQAAFNDGDVNGFVLVRINGTLIYCTGPGDQNANPSNQTPGSTTASGGSVPGGNGTTTLTTICDNPDNLTPMQGDDAAITAADIARGVVEYESHTVSSKSGNGSTSPAEDFSNTQTAADVSNGGNSADPDLVSAEFRPAATSSSTANDRVLFTFDENVATANAGQFYVYSQEGDLGTPGIGTAQINDQNRTQVLVDFPNGTLRTGVGVYVEGREEDMNASTPAVTAQDNGVGNQMDEVGVNNPQQTAGQTPGVTAAPGLTDVTLFQGQNDFGSQTGFQARYTFDEDVDSAVANRFFLYLADGTRLIGNDLATTPARTEENDNTVTVQRFVVDSNNDGVVNGSEGTNFATSAQVGNATLGTVQNDAVNDEGTTSGQGNPEGAEFTTGGTGTRAA